MTEHHAVESNDDVHEWINDHAVVLSERVRELRDDELRIFAKIITQYLGRKVAAKELDRVDSLLADAADAIEAVMDAVEEELDVDYDD